MLMLPAILAIPFTLLFLASQLLSGLLIILTSGFNLILSQ
jgi:hypothetical protein